MPRKAKHPADSTGIGDPPDPSGAIEERTYEDAQEFLESFGGSASFCRIERVLKNGERENCETVGFDELRDDIAEYLRIHWGPGRYFVGLLNEQKRWVTKRTINVAMRPNALNAASMPSAFQAAGSDQMAMMREQMVSDRQLLMTLLSNQRGPDIGTLLTGIAALNKPSDPAQMLASLMTAFQTVRQSVPDVDPMTRARELIGLAKELSPGAQQAEAAPTDWLGVVQNVGGRLAEGLGSAVKISSASLAQQAAVSAPAAAPVPAIASGVGVRTMEDFARFVREGIVFLRAKAKTGKSPEFWADYLFEESADDRFNAIIHAVQTGATIENLFDLAPEIAASPLEAQWFRALYVAIRESLSEAGPALGSGGSENLDTARPAGNSADTGNNGLSGADRQARAVSDPAG